MDIKNDQGLLEAIAEIIGGTSCFLSKTDLEHFLEKAGIFVVDSGARSNGYVYQFGLRKSKWLFNCFAQEINRNHSTGKVSRFIEDILNPVHHTKRQEQYFQLVTDVNKALMLYGCEIDALGKIVPTVKAQSLNEVERRTNEFRAELAKRAIHCRVMNYCKEDLLKNDFRSAVMEAAKGLADRIRDETGSGLDGAALFNEALKKNDPLLYLNDLSDDSKINEQNGLKELLCAIFHLVRNPMAHKPKVKWDMQRNEALDVFVLISLAHKYLDECCVNPVIRLARVGS